MTLDRKAREFVRTLQDVLNGSVTHGISLTYVGDHDGDVGFVGYGIRRHEDLTGSPFPVTISKKSPSCWLWVNQTLTLEQDGNLKTVVARAAVFADSEGEHRLFSYEFDREADNPYPAAHLQVDAHSNALSILEERTGINSSFVDLHLPVGGVRFRPCLEDVVEFLIVEGIAEARPQWRDALAAGRGAFHRVQLRAAVRNDPDVAVDQLRSMGYGVDPPPM